MDRGHLYIILYCNCIQAINYIYSGTAYSHACCKCMHAYIYIHAPSACMMFYTHHVYNIIRTVAIMLYIYTFSCIVIYTVFYI